MTEQLLFVYNANGDLFSTVTDFAHKIIAPSTYQCRLCALTYDNFSVKQEWKSFIETLPVKAAFLHKDEFEKRYQLKTDLPAVFISKNGALTVMINRQEIDSCQSLKELKNSVAQKLEQHVQHHHSDIQ